MNQSKKRISIGESLPHGAKTEIAKITGLSESTVFKFFRYGIASEVIANKILEASKPFLVSEKQKETNKQNIISIGEKLPHGAKKEIAKITGIHYKTVVLAFKNATGQIDELLNKLLEASKPFLDSVPQLNEARQGIIKMGTFLPYGAKKDISKSTGISEQTINSFFKTGIAGADVTAKIKEASKPFLELQKELLAKQLDNVVLGEALPHGAKKKVSEITGISQQTINSFFRTGKAGADVTARIIEASTPFAEQFERVRKELIELNNLFTK